LDSISEIIKKPEGRKLEFKEVFPSKSDFAKTVISFANDAGGNIFIGIKDKPRKIIGIDEKEIQKIEEMLSNVIHDNCKPFIVPSIEFISYKNKDIIRIQIHKGIEPPYHLKKQGIEKGTYIRVGSNNRLASDEIIEELIRKKKNLSFDEEIATTKILDNLDYSSFGEIFLEKTNEKISKIGRAHV